MLQSKNEQNVDMIYKKCSWTYSLVRYALVFSSIDHVIETLKMLDICSDRRLLAFRCGLLTLTACIGINLDMSAKCQSG